MEELMLLKWKICQKRIDTEGTPAEEKARPHEWSDLAYGCGNEEKYDE